MKHRPASYLLAFFLAISVPAKAEAFEDMFGIMFRMMLTMMNVMSDMMDDDDEPWGNNWGNSFGGWPMMSGMYSPFGMGGMSPWSGMGGMSPWSGMGGMSPWSGLGGFPGGGNPGFSPWNSLGNNRGQPWNNAFGPAMPYGYASPATQGYPGANYAVPPDLALLDGRWFGSSGEVLEIRGNRFRLRHGKASLHGIISVQNNIVHLASPQTGTETRYTFVRNQSDLILQDPSGMVLAFSRYPLNRTPVHTF